MVRRPDLFGQTIQIVQQQEQPTPGGPNAGVVVDDPTRLIVISEIMYHPSRPGDTDARDNYLEEYIELHNRGIAPVDLSGWRLDRGVRSEAPRSGALSPPDCFKPSLR